MICTVVLIGLCKKSKCAKEISPEREATGDQLQCLQATYFTLPQNVDSAPDNSRRLKLERSWTWLEIQILKMRSTWVAGDHATQSVLLCQWGFPLWRSRFWNCSYLEVLCWYSRKCQILPSSKDSTAIENLRLRFPYLALWYINSWIVATPIIRITRGFCI